MNLNRAVLIMDWVGWMLMLNTLWGWVYEQTRPLLEKSIERTERRMKALNKLLKHRYGRNFEKLDIMQRVLTYNEHLGLTPYMSWWMQIFIQIKYRRIQKRLRKYGLATDEDMTLWQQDKFDIHRINVLRTRVVFEALRLVLKRTNQHIADLFSSIFQGAPAVFLFALGFILWNASKVISLWIL